MNVLMKPFIGIYHIVHKVLGFPFALFKKTEDKIIEAKDRQETKKANEIPDEHKSGLMRKKEDSKNDRPLKKYRYVVLNSMNKKETGIFEAENESEVKNFLLAQDYKVVSVKLRAAYDIEINDYQKIKPKDLAFSLTELSTYLKSGIPLVDAVKILEKQATKKSLKRSFQRLVYELLNGENLSDAMMKQNRVFPNLLVNMVKTAELTGDLATILDDMAEYYTSMERTRKQMISAMTYPAVVLTIAFGVLIFMLTYLVPQFSVIFEENNAKLPALTLAILAISDFIKENAIALIMGLVAFIVAFVILYKKVRSFRKTIQIILMHTPIISNIIIYSQVSNFTKTFASLLNHGVFITDSMEVLSKVTNNEVYKEIIQNCLVSLGKGDSISESFKGEWAFPVVAYEMLVTGESTGQLGMMMEKVADHFQSLHKTLIDQMKSLMEPLMIIVLASIVGIILLSIVQPMFSIYGQIK